MSRLLVDTHAVLWWLADDDSLSAGARAALADRGNELLVSAASVWEIAIKRALGKLEAPDDLVETISDEGFVFLAVTPTHAWRVATLPRHHHDPFDRLLAAQALVEGIAVMTADPQLGRYGVGITW